MAKKSDSFHGSSGSSQPTAPESTLAERARTLMHIGGASSLSTMSVKHPGYPFGSVMPYAIDDSGNPIVLISQMAMHTKNLRADPRATLLVAEQSGSPLGPARISVMGDFTLVKQTDEESVAAPYLAAHPESRQWAGFGDFGFYRMTVKDVYLVGGFGVMGWVTATDYAAAEPDPLAESARDIIDHMNEDHVDSMVVLIQKHLGLEADTARMTTVDRYGFTVRMNIESKSRGGRIGFTKIANSPMEVRKVLVAMVEEARG
jgi:putative heme iron utilization protein